MWLLKLTKTPFENPLLRMFAQAPNSHVLRNAPLLFSMVYYIQHAPLDEGMGQAVIEWTGGPWLLRHLKQRG